MVHDYCTVSVSSLSSAQQLWAYSAQLQDLVDSQGPSWSSDRPHGRSGAEHLGRPV